MQLNPNRPNFNLTLNLHKRLISRLCTNPHIHSTRVWLLWRNTPSKRQALLFSKRLLSPLQYCHKHPRQGPQHCNIEYDPPPRGPPKLVQDSFEFDQAPLLDDYEAVIYNDWSFGSGNCAQNQLNQLKSHNLTRFSAEIWPASYKNVRQLIVKWAQRGCW
jgi:hypothetical protein